MPDRFRLLFVCTGNICRSALAERWMRHQLDQRLGPQADVIEVASAGVRAMVGQPLDRNTAGKLRDLGGDATGFVARQLEAAMLEEADLVLVATRKHRATTARLLPGAVTRTFTIREFARLVQRVDVGALPDGSTDDRLRAVVRQAASLRGSVQKEGPGADDVIDPYGAPPAAHVEAGDTIAAALEPLVDVLAAAVDPAQAPAVMAANRKRLAEDRTAQPRARRASRSARRKRPPLSKRLVVPLTMLAVVLAIAGLVVYQAVTARGELDAAKQEVPRLRAAAVSGDVARSEASLRSMQQHTRSAREKLSGPLWGLAERLPAFGDDVVAVRTVARTVDDVAHRVLPPLVAVAGSVNPRELRKDGNQIAVAPLLAARPQLRTAQTRAARADATMAAVPSAGLVGPVRGEVVAFQRQVTELADLITNASAAAEILPPMLGAKGKKTYFLAFQNNAEARGTGGLLGAYGILHANDGKIRITRLGSNQELENAQRMPVNLGKDYTALYGVDPAFWINSNVSPHFPYAARIWMALWQRQHKQRLDGVIATDPVAMGYVLAATGPAVLSTGEKITSENAARVTMRDVYERYPSVEDNARRDRYLQRIAGAVFTRVLSGEGNPRELVAALAKAARERRLLVYSTDATVQAQLARYTISGVVPDDNRPYLGVSVNSAVPSKLDYYLERSVTYVSTSCTAAGRRSRVTATFTNAAPRRGLPPYVAFPSGAFSREDRPAALKGTPRGTNYLFVDVATPPGSGLEQATVDGKKSTVIAARERGHPVFRYKLTLRPGERRVLTLDLVEPVTGGELTVLQQPLVRPLSVTVERRPCTPRGDSL